MLGEEAKESCESQCEKVIKTANVTKEHADVVDYTLLPNDFVRELY